ncbi:hypothetical protein [Myroides sp. DF42-4-2]|uniref:hypothetical protein n=1 Tax=Myroides sp. DF42-4-2 TaxID=2746726 RepID=UPI00257835AA|nr:hypothetical protein [Myroides sp. DF42-4-2]MDM1409027.1 hypothetical protein [Myroides sp. DF42-4-2]
MSKKVFIAPRLVGSRFEDHTLPVNILEDFTALEDLVIEVAKGIYIAENSNRKRVPKGFSDGVYLKLVDMEEGSSILIFAIASTIVLKSELPLENLDNFSYFEKAKDKIIELVESVNDGKAPTQIDYKLLSYFSKIGKNLLDDESIDFGYNYESRTASNAILNKATRKKILLSSEQKTEYADSIKLFALIPEIDQKNNTFQIETEFGNVKCPLTETIKDSVFVAFNEYVNKTYVTIKGTAQFNWNDKIQEITEIESLDILDPLDVSLRINNLSKLEDNWYEGHGKALNKNGLNRFENLFNSYFENKLPLPAIFPKVDGNIQMEWKNENKNVVIEINLDTLKSEYFYYNDIDDSDEKEETIELGEKEGWIQLNNLIKSIV